MVVFLRQRVNAGEDAVGRLEAGAAVVPVYAKERVLGFLPGVKIVSISRICNRNGDFLTIRIVIVTLQNVSGVFEIRTLHSKHHVSISLPFTEEPLIITITNINGITLERNWIMAIFQ